MNKPKEIPQQPIVFTNTQKPHSHIKLFEIMAKLEDVQGYNDDMIEIIKRQNDTIDNVIDQLIQDYTL